MHISPSQGLNNIPWYFAGPLYFKGSIGIIIKCPTSHVVN